MMAQRVCYHMTCLVITVVVLLLSLTGETVDATTAKDIAGATGHWLTANADVFNGSCLSNTSRVSVWPNSQFSFAVTLEATEWDSHYVVTWITKLLLEEAIGYTVLIYDPPEDAGVYADIGTGVVNANMEVWPNDQNVDQWINIGTTSEYEAGPIGYNGLSGIYITTQTMTNNPHLTLDYYRVYVNSVQGNIAVPLFKNDSWEGIMWNGVNQMLTDPNDPTSFVCQNASMLALQGLPDAGCNNIGMFIPPQCSENPQRDCAVIYHFATYYDPGVIQSLILHYNLNFTLAFVNDEVTLMTQMQAAGKTLMFYRWSPDQLALSECVDTNGAVFNCFTRVMFPTWTATCDTGNGSPDASRVCDYEQQPLSKLHSSNLPTIAPRAAFLIKALQLTLDDVQHNFDVEANATAAMGYTDFKYVACQWIRSETSRWSAWIEPPLPCTQADIEYTVSDCDMTTLKQTITYLYIQPQSCLGGMDLQLPQHIQCNDIPITSSSSIAFIIMTIILMLLPIYLLLNAFAYLFGYNVLQRFNKCIPSSIQPYNQRLFQVLEIYLLPLSLGFIAMLITVYLNVGSVSNAACIGRPYTMTIAFALIAGALTLASLRLKQATSFKIVGRSTQIKRDIAFACLVAANVILIAIDFLVTTSSPVLTTVVNVDGGAELTQLYCNTGSSAFMWVLLVANAIWSIYGLSTIISVISKTAVLASDDSTNNNHQSIMRSNTNERRKRQYRSLYLQSLSICLSLLSLFIFIIIITYLALFSNLNTSNLTIVNAQNILIILGIFLSLFSLFLPTIYNHFFITKKSDKNNNNKNNNNDKEHSVNTSTQSLSESSDNTSHYGRSSLSSSTITTSFMQQNDKQSLNNILNNPLLAYILYDFATKNFDGENITFLISMRTYLRMLRTHNNNNKNILCHPQQIYNTALLIFDTFIKEGSIQQVNISALQRQQIDRSMKDLFKLVSECNKEEENANINLNTNTNTTSTTSHLTINSYNNYTITNNLLQSPTNKKSGDIITGVIPPTPSRRTKLSPSAIELRRYAKEMFAAAIKEVNGLVTTNTLSRFVNSAAAESANELMNWANGFDLLDDNTKKAMLELLHKSTQLDHADDATVAHDQQGGGDGEARLLHDVKKSSTSEAWAARPTSDIVPGSVVRSQEAEETDGQLMASLVNTV